MQCGPDESTSSRLALKPLTRRERWWGRPRCKESALRSYGMVYMGKCGIGKCTALLLYTIRSFHVNCAYLGSHYHHKITCEHVSENRLFTIYTHQLVWECSKIFIMLKAICAFLSHYSTPALISSCSHHSQSKLFTLPILNPVPSLGHCSDYLDIYSSSSLFPFLLYLSSS